MSDLARIGCDVSHLPYIDTQLIDQGLYYEKWQSYRQVRSLRNLISGVGYKSDPKIPFHNAGNDAFYTMTAFLRLKAQVDAGSSQSTDET